jgi:hypothetical protein
MGQLRFFKLSRRYECLDANNDPLVAIAAISRGAGEGGRSGRTV